MSNDWLFSFPSAEVYTNSPASSIQQLLQLVRIKVEKEEGRNYGKRQTVTSTTKSSLQNNQSIDDAIPFLRQTKLYVYFYSDHVIYSVVRKKNVYFQPKCRWFLIDGSVFQV